ncbi:MAG: outer membrane protein assembly factor BamD [Acidobacteriota bacterium]|nr:outer membrane protein assembly factor BamD [Acidobacteriota bacterium]
MKKALLLLVGLSFIAFGAASARAQGTVREPDSAALRDPALEKDSLHNLDAAWQYFKLKKAYRASLSRAEEIIAGYPNFSKIDEALYIAGMSDLYLSEKKDKQQPALPVEKHREEARDYLTRLVKEHPDSRYRKEAEESLQSLGDVPKSGERQPPQLRNQV